MYNNCYREWAYLSIFYNRQEFHQILRDCINPFLKEIVEMNLADNYIVSLSNNQGEHLRISLSVVAQKLSELDVLIKSRIGNYLELFPSTTRASLYSEASAFLDFTPNSIYYNLYDEVLSAEELHLRSNISKAVLKALTREQVDKEAIFTFCAYIQIILFSEYQQAPALDLEIKHIKESLFSQLNPQSLSGIHNHIDNLLKCIGGDLEVMLKEVQFDLKTDNLWLRELKQIFGEKSAWNSSFSKSFVLTATSLARQFELDEKRYIIIWLSLQEFLLKIVKNEFSLVRVDL